LTELTPEQLKKQNNNRRTLVLIAGIPLTVILTATWLWVYVINGDLDLLAITGTQNRGTLITPPQQMDELTLTRSGEEFKYSEQDRKWTFLIPGGRFCDSTCEQTLYLTRQIHTALGKEALRLRRYYLATDGVVGADLQILLSEEHPRLQSLESADGEFNNLLRVSNLPAAGAAQGVFYVVDPQGWMMMVYTPKNTYKDTISDMKFLLKNSRED
jgi:hypothetical protein